MKAEKSETIKRLEGRVGQLEGDLRVARKQLEEARIAEAEFKVGDVVEAQLRGRDWEEVIIRAVEPHGGWNWYRASRRKRNGDWATAEQRVFDGVRWPVRVGTSEEDADG